MDEVRTGSQQLPDRCANSRCQRVEEHVEVDDAAGLGRGQCPAARERPAGAGELQADEPVGHTGQAELPDPRDRARVDRRDALVADVELNVGETVAGQLDLPDRADLVAGHRDQVTPDELPGIGELRVQDVARAAGQQDHGDHDDREGERHDRDDTRERVHPPIGARAFPPQNSAVPTIPIRWMPRILATIDCAVALPTPTGPPVTW